MNEHSPVELQASPIDLSALAWSIDAFGWSPDDGCPHTVVIQTAEGSLAISAASAELAHMFEVFTLTIQHRPFALGRVAGTRRWPFGRWDVSVLVRREWLGDPEKIPADFQPGRYPFELQPDEVPPGAEHSCRVAVGLLFTSDAGCLLIAASPEVPMTLLVSEDHGQVHAFVADCQRIRLADYVARLTP